MKLADRIRPIAEGAEYAEFRGRWERFVSDDHLANPGDVTRILSLGSHLEHRLVEVTKEHAIAQIRGRPTLTSHQVVREAGAGMLRQRRKLLPELDEFMEWVHEIRVRTEANHA